LAGIVTAVYLLFFASKEYEDLIPGESKVVAEIVPDDFEQISGVLPKMTEAAGIFLNGVDLSRSAYLFVSPNEYYGMTLALKDATALGNALQARVGGKQIRLLEPSDGLRWAWSEKGWMMAWSDRALLVMGPATWQESDDLRRTIRQIFKADASKSFRHSASYEDFKALGNASRLYASPEALPSPFGVLARLDVPRDVDPERVRLFATLHLGASGPGPRLKMEGTLTGCDEATQKRLEAYDAGDRSLKAEDFRELPGDVMFRLAATSHSDNLLQLLRSDATMKALLLSLEKNIDRESLKECDNCFSLAVSALDKDRNATYLLRIVRNDSVLYLSKSPRWSMSGLETDTIDVSADLRAYFKLNLNTLMEQPCFDASTRDWMKNLSGNCSTIVYRAKKGRKVSWTLQ